VTEFERTFTEDERHEIREDLIDNDGIALADADKFVFAPEEPVATPAVDTDASASSSSTTLAPDAMPMLSTAALSAINSRATASADPPSLFYAPDELPDLIEQPSTSASALRQG
jgi:hypothetical protein